MGSKRKSPSRAVRSLEYLLRGTRWKLSQRPPITHSHSSESQRQLGNYTVRLQSALFPLLMGEGGCHSWLNHLQDIQNVSYRHFIFRSPGFAKVPQRGSWRSPGLTFRQNQAMTKSISVTYSSNYNSQQREFSPRGILGSALNVTAFSLQ